MNWTRSHGGKITLISGYLAQAYGVVLSLAFVPYILRTIGAESYGLVGVFLLAMNCFQLLDAGMTAALTRETSRYKGGAGNAQALTNTLRGLESVVWLSALPILVLTWLISDNTASQWIKRETLSHEEVVIAFNLMAPILLLRWWSEVRRGISVGLERHATLNAVDVTLATLRFPGIAVLFSVIQPSSTAYFSYQLLVGLFEAMLLTFVSARIMPVARADRMWRCIRSLRTIAPFALNHAVLALLWVLVSQTDKFLLSKLLSLSQFGYFTLAVTAAGGVFLLTLPITQMLRPRLTRLQTENSTAQMHATYRRFSRIAAVFLSASGVCFACFGPPIILVWTADAHIAREAGAVFAWYSAGNAALAISGFAYHLQYAMGNLRRAIVGASGFLLILAPALILATQSYGMLGAAITWAATSLLYLLIWVTVVHRKLLNGQHWNWLFNDVLRIVVPTLLVAMALRQWIALPQDRILLAFTLLTIGFSLFLVALASSGLLSLHTLAARRAAPVDSSR